MKLLNYCFAFLFFVSSSVFAQKALSNLISSEGDMNGKVRFELRDNFSGSAYLYDKWDKSGLIYTTAEIYLVAGINLNIESGQFEIKVSKDSIFKIEQIAIDSVKIDNDTFKYDVLKNKKFSQVLFESNKVSFYKTFTLVVKQGTYNPLNGNTTPNTYSPKEKYAIFFKQEILSNFNLNKKNILNLFLNESNLIEAFVKQNKLSYNKESDVTKILKYYTTL